MEKVNWDAYFPMKNDRNKERLGDLLGPQDSKIMNNFNRFLDSFDDDLLMFLVEARVQMPRKIRFLPTPNNQINSFRISDDGDVKSSKIVFKWHENVKGETLSTFINYTGDIYNVVTSDGPIQYKKVPEILSDHYSDYIIQIKKYLIYD